MRNEDLIHAAKYLTHKRMQPEATSLMAQSGNTDAIS